MQRPKHGAGCWEEEEGRDGLPLLKNAVHERTDMSNTEVNSQKERSGSLGLGLEAWNDPFKLFPGLCFHFHVFNT